MTSCPCPAVQEMLDHLFLYCRVAQALWISVLGWFVCRVFPWTILDLFETWMVAMGSFRGRIMWKLSFLVLYGFYGRKEIYAALKTNFLLLHL